MSAIQVCSMDGGVVCGSLRNDQLPEAVTLVLAECERQYGGVPVKIEISTWDMDYGDVLPDGFVMARPRVDAWAAHRRIQQAQAALKGLSV